MNKLIVQIFKFGLVGGVAFVIDYGLMIFMTEVVGIYYLISSGISFAVSVVVNYILSMKFVFKKKENSDRTMEFILFLVLSVIGLGINQMIMWLLVDKGGVYYMLSKIIATFLVMVYNFITRKLIIEK